MHQTDVPIRRAISASTRAGLLTITGTGLAIIVWTLSAPIDGAIHAYGTLASASNRQIVQHLEGGIVQNILVRNGDLVQKNQHLVLLDPTSADAELAETSIRLGYALVKEARLVAEHSQAPTLELPELPLPFLPQDTVSAAAADEKKLLLSRKAALETRIAILREATSSARAELKGLAIEQGAIREQLLHVDAELADLAPLVKKGLVPKAKNASLQRDKANLEGSAGQTETEIAKTAAKLDEIHQEIIQTQQEFSESVNQELLEVRQEIARYTQETSVASDILSRTTVVSPVAGRVHNLSVYTNGGTITPGQILMEIVPDRDTLTIDVQVPVSAVEQLTREMTAEIRFMALATRSTPLILGRLRDVSRDRSTDPYTDSPFYLAKVDVEDTDIPPSLKTRLKPGMPAEIIFATGTATPAQRLLDPATKAMNKAFRER